MSWSLIEVPNPDDHPVKQLADGIWRRWSHLPASELHNRLDAVLAAHEIKAYALVEQLLARFELDHCPRCLRAFADRDREIREQVGELCVSCYNTALINADLA